MKEIDWDSAPLGTTHCAPDSVGPWHRHDSRGNFYWHDSRQVWEPINWDIVECAANYPQFYERPKSELRDLLPEKVGLRDEFALAAMKGFITSAKPQAENMPYPQFAELCYALADAMLAERAK